MFNNKSNKDLKKSISKVNYLLKIRYRSEKEIRDKLKEKKFNTKIIDKTIRYFYDLDLIDDRRFSRLWISSRFKKPYGINRIRYELKEKGIDKNIIDQEIKNATDNYEEIEIVRNLAKNKSLKYKNIDKNRLKQRLYNQLIRQGFSYHTVYKVVNES